MPQDNTLALFRPDIDAAFYREGTKDERSFLTFMIYLNGGFKGGKTNFLRTCDKDRADRVLHTVDPQAGTALLFTHDLLHEGAELLGGGFKYIMRSDGMAIPQHTHQNESYNM
eukprot:GEZU01002591.1.p1 GENE.GEZU01002591.1~~GEZU01002591.1.p1  ORF type:complete len:113 (+),score=13.42 GEZU01002591.1:316-654(+)